MDSTRIISLVLFICLLGPCRGDRQPRDGGSVSTIVTKGFFNNIIKQAGKACMGNTLYTRNSFIDATNTFPNFANSVTRREIATMFAHVTHETGRLCYTEELRRRSRGNCDQNVEQIPCTPPSKGYFSRSPSHSLINLVRQPDLVGGNPTVSFRKGLSFWINSVRPVLNQGFGATIKAINGMECKGGNSGAANARIGYYKDYCRQLGVDPGPNLSC